MRLIVPALLCFALALPALGAGKTLPITTLAYQPDGSAIVSNGERAIQLRDPNTGAVISEVPCDLPRVTALVFDTGGERLAVGGGEPGISGQALLCDGKTMRELRRFGNHRDLVTSVAMSPDADLVASGSMDHTCSLWKTDGDSKVPAQTLTGHAGPVLAIAFNPAAKEIVTGSADRSIKVWSSETGALLRTFTQHSEGIHTLVFRPSPSGPAFCFSGANDRSVRVWQPSIGRMVRIIRKHEGPILTLATTPDGAAIFSAGAEGIIRELDPNSDGILREWRASDDWVYALAVSPDGGRIAAGDWRGRVSIWDRAGRGINPRE